MIREVKNLDEVPLAQIERLGKLFVEESGSAKEFDIGHFVAKMKYPLELGVAKIWVFEKDSQIVGIIGGISSQLFFVKDVISIEMFWFVDKENRGSIGGIRLLETFEEWADKESEWTHVAFMERIHPDKMLLFLENRGYEKFETILRKRRKV